MANAFSTTALIDYVRTRAPFFNLDSAAVLSVASQEGLGGGIGDGGHAFGPWQLNDAGGQFPKALASLSTTAKQQWAWSPEGVDFALQRISGVAAGLSGHAAIRAIATFFEAPRADLLPGEIAGASAQYPTWQQGGIPIQPAPGGSLPATDQLPGEAIAQATAAPTGGIAAGSIGPFAINLPSGLILALIGALLLIVGALLFTFNLEKQATGQVSNFIGERLP